jgi:Orn/Lys/Arg decarboxylase, C-terminal domain
LLEIDTRQRTIDAFKLEERARRAAIPKIDAEAAALQRHATAAVADLSASLGARNASFKDDPASQLTPYPPGIPLLIPGERFNKKIVDYLKFTRMFNAAFPGFDTDVHGLVESVDDAGGQTYYVDCVRSE